MRCVCVVISDTTATTHPHHTPEEAAVRVNSRSSRVMQLSGGRVSRSSRVMQLWGGGSGPVLPIKPLLDVSSAPRPVFDGAAPTNVSGLTGTAAYLHCLVHNLGNSSPIKYDSPRGGITVLTERGNTTTGYLLIQAAGVPDTGNYSCSPSNTSAATIRVHVLNGETPAAMQTNVGGTASPSSLLLLLTLTAALQHPFLTMYGCHPYI
ncbi:hypothetical protein Hamer_G024427 [Homarus americanus]|uniref:Ig-like domain-containing protein n=1 Tax=Homarus americanus TaxID=6706 RepID=A0A8J5K566_HOMAM|nr:hypothetical protein Hamer_G024427 [Homarus americanus]